MNTYEKLVYLATEPFGSQLILSDTQGNKMKSSLAVREALNDEFVRANLPIDVRLACETKVTHHSH